MTANQANVPADCVISIPFHEPRVIYVRPIAEPDVPRPTGSTASATGVISDIEPYRSVVDGSVIGGRRQHRDHLRAHRKIEVGNEYNKYLKQDFRRETRGDFNCRPQLKQALEQVLSK